MSRGAIRTKYPVKSLIKALRVLDMLGESETGFGVTELSQHLHITKSGVHRLLATLKDEGYVMLDPINGRYTLGIKVLRLSEQLSHQSALLRAGIPIVRRLSESCNETVNLGILEGRDVLYAAKQESTAPLRMSGQVGRRLPAYCTGLGKAMLAVLSNEQVRELYRNTARFTKTTVNTVGTLEELLSQLAKVRSDGIAYDNEEMYMGVNCMAAPVRGLSGRVVAAISVSIPKYRLKSHNIAQMKNKLLEAAAQLSRSLGYVSAQAARAR